MPTHALHYVLRSDKSVRNEVVRILDEIAARGQFLAGREGDPGEELVHEGRLLIKRLRALMWFARPALGPTVYAKAQADLRNAAGMLAGSRDLVAARTTLEDLQRTLTRKRDEQDVARVRADTECPISGADDAVVPVAKFREAMGLVGAAIADLAQAVRAREEWPSPQKRVERASHVARKAARRARETNRDADFHTWRKKAKRLLYLLELTQPQPTRRMARLIGRVEKLQDHLGHHHDQVVTESRLRAIYPLPASARRVLRLLARSKKRLAKKARKLKRKIGRTI